MLLHRGHARSGIEGARAKLASVSCEEALDAGGALGHVQVPVHHAAIRGGAFGGASGPRHHDRQAARDRLRDTQPKGLIRARVNEEVGASERTRELRPVLFEAGEMNSLRRASLESTPLGSIAEEDENAGAGRPDHCESVEENVPALVDRKSADSYEKSGPFPGFCEPLRPLAVVARAWMKRSCIHAERDMNDVADASPTQPFGLCAPGREHGVEGQKQGSHALPEWRRRELSAPRPEPTIERRLDVRADVVGMPEGGADSTRTASASDNGRCGEVRRVSLEDVSLLAKNLASNLIDASEQVIRGVVGQRGPSESNQPRGDPARRHRFAHPSIFIAGPGGHNHMLMTQLA